MMPSFTVDQLEVHGYRDALYPVLPNDDNADRPSWIWPILRVKGGGALLAEMEEMVGDAVVVSEVLEETPGEEPWRIAGYLKARYERGNATLLETPIPAIPEGLYYHFREEIEYVSDTEPRARFLRFAEEQNRLGDEHFRAGRMREAYVCYEHAFAMSKPENAGGRTPEHCARMLATDTFRRTTAG